MQQTILVASAWPVYRRFSTRSALTLAGLMAMGMALRLFLIGRCSYWSDEVASILWIRNSFHFLWTTGLMTDPTPPLYYTLLKIWVALVGSEAEGPVRMLSAIASTVTIPLVYLLALEFMASTAALLAAGLFALNPMQIYYSQEARGYALIPLLVGLSLLGMVRYAKNSDHRGRALLLYGFGAILLLYAHATATVTLAALNLAFLIHLMRGDRSGGRLLSAETMQRAWPLLLTDFVLLAVDFPLLWFDVHPHATVAWIEKPHLISVLGAFTSFAIDPVSPQILFRLSCLVTLAFGGLLALGLIRARVSLLIQNFLIAPPLLFLTMSIVISFFKPFFIPRVTIWIPLPLCLLAAYSLQHEWRSIRPRRMAFPVALTGCVLLTLGLGWQGVYVRGFQVKEDWRGLTGMLSTRSDHTDEFVVGPATDPMPLNLYGERAGQIRFGTMQAPLWRWAPYPVASMLWLPDNVAEPGRLDTAGLVRDMQGSRPVWLILGQRDWNKFGARVLAMLPPPHRVDRSHPQLFVISNR